MRKTMLSVAVAAALYGGALSQASATTIGLLSQGSQYNAFTNLNYIATNNLITTGEADSLSTLSNATFNAMSPSALAAAYDILVMPWYVDPDANFDWSTRLLPYLNAGGSILWENPNDLGELAASGISLSNGFIYSAPPSSIVLTSPFGDAGAEGFYHIHYSITGKDSTWNAWSVDGNGAIHGVNKEFAGGGRMVLGVSDNLYHPYFPNAYDWDHRQLAINQLNWLDTGTITGVPEPSSIALLGLGLFGLAQLRRKKSA